MTLRPYQEQAVEAIVKNYNTSTQDLIVVPQGGGKSLIIAHAVDKLNEKTLIISPSKEITRQNSDKMKKYRKEEEVGIYSASFNLKQARKFTFATIQSVYKQPQIFNEYKYIFIDEAHTTPDKNLTSMFSSFMENINAKIFGFTATPYRTYRHDPIRVDNTTIKQKEELRMLTHATYTWDSIIFYVNYSFLVENQYLTPLKYVRDTARKKKSIYKDLLEKNGLSTLLFAKNVSQARKLAIDWGGESVSSKTKKSERDNIINRFLNQENPLLCNYETLVTGFDAPHINAIMLLRKFSSITQYTQAIGRATRLHPRKKKGIIIDMAGNTDVHGRLEDIEVYYNPSREAYEVWGYNNNTNKISRIDGIIKTNTVKTGK